MALLAIDEAKRIGRREHERRWAELPVGHSLNVRWAPRRDGEASVVDKAIGHTVSVWLG